MTDKTARKRLLRNIIWPIVGIAALLAADLLSKAFVFSFLENSGDSCELAGGIFRFVRAENFGASFGIFNGKAEFLIILTSVVTLALIVVLFLFRDAPPIFRCAMILLIGGSLGNIVDRVALGYVRDFIDYAFLKTFFDIDFAIGNVADIFLCVGVLLLIVYIMFSFDGAHFRLRPAAAPTAEAEKAISEDTAQGAVDNGGEVGESEDVVSESIGGGKDSEKVTKDEKK